MFQKTTPQDEFRQLFRTVQAENGPEQISIGLKQLLELFVKNIKSVQTVEYFSLVKENLAERSLTVEVSQGAYLIKTADSFFRQYAELYQTASIPPQAKGAGLFSQAILNDNESSLTMRGTPVPRTLNQWEVTLSFSKS